MLPNEETIVARRPDPYIGMVIDKYKLVERLGAGGMGLVYRAEQARMDRHVAVKLLPFTLVNDEVNVKRIEREAKAMGNLRHPNIATIFDFGFSEEYQPYLVMELITGRSLGSLLHEYHSLDPQRVAKIITQAADAMDYAHKHGIIHRDLKPDNIMLDDHHTEDFVTVLDFGIAKSVDNAVNLSQSLTRPGTVIGSPLYMSPEQCVGQKLDAQTDIYSIGVIMYELITGTIPGKGATIYETIGKKTTEPPPPFPAEFSEFKDLEELTLACLATLKSERPESMQEVRDRLRAMVSSTMDIQTPVAAASLDTKELATKESTSLAGSHVQTTGPVSPVPVERTVEITSAEKVTSSITDAVNKDGSGRTPSITLVLQKVRSAPKKVLIVCCGVAAFAIGGVFAVLNQGSTPPMSSESSMSSKPADSVRSGDFGASSANITTPTPSVTPTQPPSTQSNTSFPYEQSDSVRNSSKPISGTSRNYAKTLPPKAPPRYRSKPAPKPAPARSYTQRYDSKGQKGQHKIPPGLAKKKGRFDKVPKKLQRFFKHLRQGSF